MLYARQIEGLALSLSDCLGLKKGTSVLVRVAKLLRLSILIKALALLSSVHKIGVRFSMSQIKI